MYTLPMQLNLIDTSHGISGDPRLPDEEMLADYRHFGKVNEYVTVHANGTTDERFKHHTSVVVHLGRLWFQGSPTDMKILARELLKQARLAEQGVYNFNEVSHVR